MSYPWIEPPPGFQAFDTHQQIATPAVGVDTEVLRLTVADGYDGVIRRLSNNYTGPNFVQGSGQILWRLLIDQMVVKNYGRITIEMGSPQWPRETDGILLRSGQVVRYVVNVSDPVLAGSASGIICSLGGYFWPKEAYVDSVR